MSKDVLQQAVEALKSCETGGYRDIDGDWAVTRWFDKAKVKSAIAALESAIQQQEAGSPSAIVDAIARQWDGCMAPMFDATGNPTDAIDIGATIRADGIPAAAPSPLQQEAGSGYEFAGGFLLDRRADGSTRWNQVSKQYENDGDVVKLYRAAAPSTQQGETK